MPLSLFLSLPLSLFLWGCTKHFNQSYPRSRSLSLCSWNTPSTMKGFQELLLSTFPHLRILWKGFGKLDDLVHTSNVILIVKGWQNISANMKCESLPVHRAFKVLSTNTPELVRNQEETNAHSCFSLRSNYAFIETMLENYLNFRGEEEKKNLTCQSTVSSKGTLGQQQIISTAPGLLFFLSPLPTLMGWQSPAPQSHLWHPRLPTDTRMHWWSRAQEDRNKQIPSLHQNIKNWRLYKIILKLPRFFTSSETWVRELCLMGSVAKQFS